MSRKYCEVCGEKHQNGGEGLCDKHLEIRENQYIKEYQKRQQEFMDFMDLPEIERWSRVFDAIQEGE